MKIDGKEYDEKELDFTNILCDLEDRGIDIVGMSGEDVKPFTLCRAIVSVYTGEPDLKKCGKLLTSHLQHGGTLDDIMDPFTEAMNAAGFGNAEETPVESPTEENLKVVKK